MGWVDIVCELCWTINAASLIPYLALCGRRSSRRIGHDNGPSLWGPSAVTVLLKFGSLIARARILGNSDKQSSADNRELVRSAAPCVIASVNNKTSPAFQVHFLHGDGCSGGFAAHVVVNQALGPPLLAEGGISVHLWLPGIRTGGPSPSPMSLRAINTLICPTIHSPVLFWRNVR